MFKEFNEFNEFSNPEEKDYDIKMSNNSNYYREKLMDLIGVLEDINEDDFLQDYGITINEYFNPTSETIQKVEEHLKDIHTRRR